MSSSVSYLGQLMTNSPVSLMLIMVWAVLRPPSSMRGFLCITSYCMMCENAPAFTRPCLSSVVMMVMSLGKIQ